MNFYVEAVKDWTHVEKFTFAQRPSWESVPEVVQLLFWA